MTPGDKKTEAPRPDEPFGGLGATFGRRKGRPLKALQKRLFEELLPGLEIELPLASARDPDEPGASEALDVVRGSLDPQSLFEGGEKTLWLEIGYGGGEHLAALAEANPDIGFIGCEFFATGVGKMLVTIEERSLANIRLCRSDARALLASLAPSSLDRLYVLYPDPWHKKRHARRRMISEWSVSEFARVVRPGGEVRVASDIPAYVRWTLEHFAADPHFTWMAEGPADWREPWEGWTRTRYEAKAIREGRTPSYLRFLRT